MDFVFRWRKKPIEIDAMRFNGTMASASAILDWANNDDETFIMLEARNGDPDFGLLIPTLEGDMNISPGDWVIQGVQGEFYPCKPDIFHATYEDARVEALEECWPFAQARG